MYKFPRGENVDWKCYLYTNRKTKKYKFPRGENVEAGAIVDLLWQGYKFPRGENVGIAHSYLCNGWWFAYKFPRGENVVSEEELHYEGRKRYKFPRGENVGINREKIFRDASV